MLRSTPKSRFNVIMIIEDALRADRLSTYGYGHETSPEKTRFMNENGVVFLNAHSQATQTRPSVPSLMTSLYPTATGVWNFSQMLSNRYLTLAEIMRAQGFETASFIQNPNAGAMAGLQQGFDQLVSFDEMSEATEDVFGERVLDWLDARGDQNFFLYLHARDPHGVYDPPAEFRDLFRDAQSASGAAETPVRRNYLDPPWLKEPTAEARRALYEAEIRHNDTVIDAFLQNLAERGLLSNTLLIFTADHGEWMGEQGFWDHHPPGKEPVIHVPLMMAFPGLGKGGERIGETVQLIDVMPTILELAGVDATDLLMHGDSLVSLVRGLEPERWKNRVTVSEEPTLMALDSPCACGSLFIGDWQIHGTSYGAGAPASILGPGAAAFIETSMFRFKEDGVEPIGSFVPDLRIRLLRQRYLARVAAADIELWRRVTAGEAREEYRMDPETLERLRGLGYVN